MVKKILNIILNIIFVLIVFVYYFHTQQVAIYSQMWGENLIYGKKKQPDVNKIQNIFQKHKNEISINFSIANKNTITNHYHLGDMEQEIYLQLMYNSFLVKNDDEYEKEISIEKFLLIKDFISGYI